MMEPLVIEKYVIFNFLFPYFNSTQILFFWLYPFDSQRKRSVKIRSSKTPNEKLVKEKLNSICFNNVIAQQKQMKTERWVTGRQS